MNLLLDTAWYKLRAPHSTRMQWQLHSCRQVKCSSNRERYDPRLLGFTLFSIVPIFSFNMSPAATLGKSVLSLHVTLFGVRKRVSGRCAPLNTPSCPQMCLSSRSVSNRPLCSNHRRIIRSHGSFSWGLNHSGIRGMRSSMASK